MAGTGGIGLVEYLPQYLLSLLDTFSRKGDLLFHHQKDHMGRRNWEFLQGWGITTPLHLQFIPHPPVWELLENPYVCVLYIMLSSIPLYRSNGLVTEHMFCIQKIIGLIPTFFRSEIPKLAHKGNWKNSIPYLRVMALKRQSWWHHNDCDLQLEQFAVVGRIAEGASSLPSLLLVSATPQQ